LVLAAIFVIVPVVVRAQDGAQQLANTIKREDVLALPRRDRVPNISLQRALKIAERFARRKHIDLSRSYLFEARLLTDETNFETQSWHLWWVNTTRGKPDVRITVSADGKPTLLPSPGGT